MEDVFIPLHYFYVHCSVSVCKSVSHFGIKQAHSQTVNLFSFNQVCFSVNCFRLGEA